MKIGVVIHGPEIIDSGYASKILKLLEEFSETTYLKVKLGGTMGRVAVIDNNLENIIDISEKMVPSQCLKKLSDNDILILMNYGKSKETGHTFGKIVVSRANVDKPIIQIERPGEKDGTILIWDNNATNSDKLNNLINYLSEKLNLKVESCISEGLNTWKDGNKTFRKVHGVDKNETIMLNGIIIGKALENNITIVEEDGKIVDIINGEVKWHGVEKLGKINLEKAIIKTGILRRHPPNIKKNKKEMKITKKNENDKKGGEVIIINHAGEDVLEYIKNKTNPIVITIGDDTTTICGDILARFGIKIIGITDGDRDDILKDPIITEGSNIFLIKNWKDDDVGKILGKKLKNKNLTYDDTLYRIKEILNKNKIDYCINKY
ncbi:MAG: hypothetical protein PWP15_878 [Methanothermococcus sp.]|jgi:hypothetical protein|uniref:DUF2117 family protein n=1 Tax=Methanothermococcus TaxID=155862 RepID=UPI000360D4F4|nr:MULTISPECIES: DUF2117 domain-containing protein [Methanothermococcus]MDK2790371.1 hypothetical protein [Methanothermococcus sp.]MDK2978313.1 hypothetical protein [Bacteroidales bacterium]MDK2988291.1 hypothetical protein [Methanothermococcus sp.]